MKISFGISNWFENENSEDDNVVEDSDSEENFIIRSDHNTNSEKKANSYIKIIKPQIELRSTI